MSGAILREARRRVGMTQAECARRAGVTQSVVSAYENGRREPGLATLARLVESTGQVLSITVEAARAPSGALRERVERFRPELRALAAKHHLSNLRLFGSVARGQEGPDSDVDLLVDVDDGGTLLSLIGLEQDARALLGVRVDVVPAEGLKSRVASTALAEAIQL